MTRLKPIEAKLLSPERLVEIVENANPGNLACADFVRELYGHILAKNLDMVAAYLMIEERSYARRGGDDDTRELAALREGVQTRAVLRRDDECARDARRLLALLDERDGLLDLARKNSHTLGNVIREQSAMIARLSRGDE